MSNKSINQGNVRLLIRLMKMMKKNFYLYLGAIIVMGFAMSSLNTITALMLRGIIDMARSGTSEGLYRMIWKYVVMGVGVILIRQISFIIYTWNAKKGCANLQRAILTKAMRLPYIYYENAHSGDFMSKILYDGLRTEDVYGSRFRRILMPSLMVIFYLIPMFALSWQVTLCLLSISIIAFFVNGAFVNPMKQVSHKMSIAHTELTRRLSDLLSGIELVKIFSLEDKMVDGYVESNNVYKSKQKKMNILGASLESLNRFFDLTSALIFLAVGIYFISIGVTTIDRLAAIYVIYGNMNWNFLQIGMYIPSMASCLTNAKRVFEFLDLEEEPVNYEHIPQTKEDTYIGMEKVAFSYDGINNVLEDFTLNIQEGESVALKGESGKGKSTIAKLLLGLYPVESGRITVAGRDFSQMSLCEIRDMVGYVPQEPYLYGVSIEENIRYGREEASMEEVIEAAQAANIHDFIMNQENGYDTVTGERGNRLSGGERQRIAIARAILKNPPILILDEATSALDNESERLVSEAIERLMEGRTTIMIAHRASTLSRANRIIEL